MILDRLLNRSAPEPANYRYNASTVGYNGFYTAAYEPDATDSSVLGIPAAWRSIVMLHDLISAMPLKAQVNNRLIDVPVLTQPNAFETSTQ